VTLPASLEGLSELALDLRWSWSREAEKLWRRLNNVLWEATGNAWLVLQSVDRRTLDVLAEDVEFNEALQQCLVERANALTLPGWFETAHPKSGIRTIAYFSMEFGLSEALPIYAGGLGVLAGDHLKSSSDLGVPLVGVGLLYQRGYFRQTLDAQGRQLELYPSTNPGEMPITPVYGRDGTRLRIPVEMPGRTVYLRAWRANVGRVSLLLLDTNVPENTPADHGITAELYGGGPEVRLEQEIVLGIGGWRLLRTLDVPVDACHLNEGHAGLVVLERARELMNAERIPFEVALMATRGGNVFTTHTAVQAGLDRVAPSLVAQYLGSYADELGIGLGGLLALGRTGTSPDEPFTMPYLAIRGSAAVNGVSLRHGEVSRAIFQPLFPQWPQTEIPIGHVTNGVHTPSWDSDEADRIWTKACGRDRWRDGVEAIEAQFAEAGAATLWAMRTAGRAKLVEFVRRRLAQQLRGMGAAPESIHAARIALDPDVLTIGFARRFAPYKRATLLLSDPARLIRILTDHKRPVQLIVAGKAHPHDSDGKALIKAWVDFAQRPEVRGRVVFLSDYDISLAKELVQGVDLWLNNPRPPWEASGTSGMKVLVNGGLNLSQLDGWWVEAYSPEVGWAIGDPTGKDTGDFADAQAFYWCLENDIVPEFYERDAESVPRAWVEKMRRSMASLTPRYSANRMVREYVERYYLPAAQSFRARVDGHCRLAKELTAWSSSLEAFWSEISFGRSRIDAEGNGSYQFEVPVRLGVLDARDIRVELYADIPGGAQPERHALEPTGRNADGFVFYAGSLQTQRPLSDYTVRVVPDHPQALIPIEAHCIRWQR
jgi:glycogen phosphorylase